MGLALGAAVGFTAVGFTVEGLNVGCVEGPDGLVVGALDREGSHVGVRVGSAVGVLEGL